MSEEEPAPSFWVYMDLLNKHQFAARKQNEPLRRRIFDAIELFAELYPESVARFEKIYGDKQEDRG